MAESKDARLAMRALQRSEVVWYTGDQEQSVFTPLCGSPAATIRAGGGLAKDGKAKLYFLAVAVKKTVAATLSRLSQ